MEFEEPPYLYAEESRRIIGLKLALILNFKNPKLEFRRVAL